MQDENFDFELKLPKTYLYFAIAVLVLSVCLAIFYGIMFAINQVNKTVFGIVVGVASFFVIFSILGAYMFTTEKFSLNNGAFEYTAPFKGKKSVYIKDVAKVDVCKSKRKNMKDIIFFNDEGKVLLQFTDGGMALEQNKLALALDHYKIPFNQD